MTIKNFINDFRTGNELMGRHKRLFWLYMFLALIPNTLIEIGITFGMKSILDYFTKEDPVYLHTAIIVAAAVIIGGCFYFPFILFYRNRRSEMILRDVRTRLFRHLQRLPVRYFESRHSGDVLSRVNKDTEAYGATLGVFEQFSWSFVGMGLIIPYIIGLDWRFGLITIGMSLIAAFVNLRFIQPMREKSREIHKESAVLTEAITDNVTGFNVIRMFGLKGLFMTRFLEKLGIVNRHEYDRIKIAATVYVSNIFIGWTNQGLLSVLGCYMAYKGMIEVGVLVGTIPICRMLTGTIINLAHGFMQAQEPFAGTDRLNELLQEPPEPESYQQREHRSAAFDGIRLQNAVFGYEKAIRVIDNLSIEVARGTSAALVGDSGGGKSTIIKLLSGLYELWDGEMTIEGRAAGAFRLEELRQLAAYVPQDAYIFNGTVRENILHGRPDATDADGIEAAKQANAHEFITGLADGYDTVVGERGIKLSGGQRQRVAIARAVIKNAPILLLDEATSSLDSESETLVQDALGKLMQGKTSVVVAHRLSTIEKADIIYVIREGRVEQQGTHTELLAQGGKYAELYNREFGQIG